MDCVPPNIRKYYNWDLYLPVGGNNHGETLRAFHAHLEELG